MQLILPSRQHLGLCPWLRLPCVDLLWTLCGPCVDLCPWLWLPCVDTKSIRGEKRFSAVFNFTLEPEHSRSSKSYNIQNHFNCTAWTLQCELFGGSASCPQCCISASIPSTHKCNPEHVLWLKLFISSFLPPVFYNFGSEYVTLWPECGTILALTVLQFCLWMYYNL